MCFSESQVAASVPPTHTYPWQVVLGDRDQDATMRRLQYYSQHLTRRDSRHQVGETGCGWGAM